jgi:hypothetical protein
MVNRSAEHGTQASARLLSILPLSFGKRARYRAPVLIPPRKFITLFDELLTPIFAQLRNLRHQNQKLHTARDLLLPRLMSGEIAV